ncbi:ATPase, T2SS/T4P/T4SS family [Trinickia acidisoli]|uniref:ATPase, T2SS/T4P/T4SS family n=1 Tax=Trinickia acidisoli TaxID=2767482 RepID=UPI001A9034FF|nr:ATPase, T2SS/T4P/T4SS family [Trinickia acidisoli]
MNHDQSVDGLPLKALPFSDLYLEPDGAWFKNSPSDRERRVLDQRSLDESLSLRRRLQEHRTGLDFRAEWEGIGLRVQRIETLEGDVYICRRLLDRPIEYGKLGYPPRLLEALLSEAFSRGGLVLWTGATGDGKSMSQASWMIERLRRYGGTACTIENPVEIVLQGRHGSGTVVGTCYQTEVQNDSDFGPTIHRLLRAAPNLIMLGEIRTREAAAQAVLAGTSGHLVSSTLHANDVQTALERMKNMVRESGLEQGFMADALSAVIHQSMRITNYGGVERRILTVTPLVVASATNETAIRATLRKGDFSQLSSEIDRQRRIAAALTESGRL